MKSYTSKLGAYPVIYLTLKDAGLMNYEYMIMQMKTIMMDMFYEHRYVLDSDKIPTGEKNIFTRILNAEATDIDLVNSLKVLSKMLYIYYDKPVIVLIDEYDVPIQSAYTEHYYDDAIRF